MLGLFCLSIRHRRITQVLATCCPYKFIKVFSHPVIFCLPSQFPLRFSFHYITLLLKLHCKLFFLHSIILLTMRAFPFEFKSHYFHSLLCYDLKGNSTNFLYLSVITCLGEYQCICKRSTKLFVTAEEAAGNQINSLNQCH